MDVPYLEMLRQSNPKQLRLMGRSIEIVDPFWVVGDFLEIFWRQIYHFEAKRPDPVILDCGANIGLSVLYFKLLYPQSRVTAFEADRKIFEVMHRNLERFEIRDVNEINKAVWIDDSTLNFVADGGVGGRLVSWSDGGVTSVPATRLRDYLQQPVDFLKLDIEGAETAVLEDCRDLLGNIDKIFIEFHGDPQHSQNLQDILAMLSASGFRYYIKEAVDERRPLDFNWRWKRFDVQLNIFAGRDAA
ncbi:MAG: FkbM family methyltransferase [Thermoanaerobaculia bacterium]